jgi:HPt (histidine-containing phosphotransfer) domain-containing protein
VLEEKLAALREDYRRTLPAQLDALRARVESGRASGGLRVEARSLAHRLKGTAGSYGFDRVAAELESVEEILDRSQGATEIGLADAAAIDAALARARDSLA